MRNTKRKMTTIVQAKAEKKDLKKLSKLRKKKATGTLLTILEKMELMKLAQRFWINNPNASSYKKDHEKNIPNTIQPM